MYFIQQKELLKTLNRSIKDNETVDFQHIKIFLTGSAAAGKTNFRRLLLKHIFVEAYTSTEFQETEHVYAMQASLIESVDEGTKWLPMTIENQIEFFNTLLKNRRLAHKQSQESLSIVQIPTCDENGENVHDELTAGLIQNKGLPEGHIIGDTVKLITIVDTGGQPGYIHLLPVLNSPATSDLTYLAINCVVHDMTKSLDDPVMVRYREKDQEEIKPYDLQYTNKELIKQLFSITATTATNISNSYVSFIGTHKDKLESGDDERHKAIGSLDKQLKALVDELVTKSTTTDVITGVGQFEYIIPVDNTTAGSTGEDSIVQSFRHKIESLHGGINKLPIAWMILELHVKKACGENLKYISYDDYLEIARDKANISSEEDIKNSLHYFHLVGVFLYFSALSNYVIVDQQWFYNQLSKLICVSSESKEIPLHGRNIKQKFVMQGMLSKSQLEHIEVEGDIPTKDFIKLLCEMKVMAMHGDNCYLPYVLPYYHLQNDNYKFLLLEPLLVSISPGCIPRGFFSYLRVCIIFDLPKYWQPLHDQSQYRNVMAFLYKNEYCIRFYDKNHYLEVQVRHYTYSLRESMYPVFKSIHHCVDKVCRKFNFGKFQYGFVCHGTKGQNDHMVVVSAIQGPNECNLEDLYCDLCQRQIKIRKLHRLWFENNSK